MTTSAVTPVPNARESFDGEVHPAQILPPAQLAGRIQHTLPGESVVIESDVRRHVQQTLEHGFDAAFVPACWVKAARDEANGSSARIGSFIDYPFGTGTAAGRVAEAKALVDLGVDEIDATVPIGYLLSSRTSEFAADLKALVEAASPIGIKVMLELPLLIPAMRTKAVQAAVDAGVAFVQNASRGAVGIADPATITHLRRNLPPSIGVKAAGGIKTIEQVRAVLVAGADLVGTAAGIAIVTGSGRPPGNLESY